MHGRTEAELAALRREIARIPVWYHCIELGDGVVTPGRFDMRAHLGAYPLPADAAGLRVLDVGASNGFFSFELERRGAREVVAVDLASYEDHDWGAEQRARLAARHPEERRWVDATVMRGAFEVARAALGSRVERRELSVYDLAPERVGTFDLVLCASVLMHLRDPVLALQRLRSVCASGGRLVVSVATILEDRPEPLAAFVAEPEQCNYWQMNPACLKRMVAFAGFTPVADSRYLLRTTDGLLEEPRFVCLAEARARGA